MSFRNSIFAGNAAGDFPDIDPRFGTFQNLGNNLLGQAPLLGPLTNNGGPTRTHALLAGSPAINSGNDCVLIANGCGDDNPGLATDQRGAAREAGVDIGAFEFSGPALVFEIGGRVRTAGGLPVRGARVYLDGDGDLRSTLTNPFGYFRFPDVPGGNYTITVGSKRHGSTATTVTLISSITDLEFVL